MQTELIYTVIIRKRKTVLCEFTDSSGNFSQITKRVLEKVNDINLELFRATFTLENYSFYTLLTNNIYIIAMSTKVFSSKNDDKFFCYLYKMNNLLQSKYTSEQLEKAFAFSLNEFVNELSVNMDLFNSTSKGDFDDYKEEISRIDTDDSLNGKTFESGQPFAILTKNQIHQDQPTDMEKSCMSDCSNEFGATFLSEECVPDDTLYDRNKSKSTKRKIFITILIILLLLLAGVGVYFLFFK